MKIYDISYGSEGALRTESHYDCTKAISQRENQRRIVDTKKL